jgi:putative membrane protein
VATARKDGIEVPSAPTPTMVWQLDMVRNASGGAFDYAYSSLEVKDHEQDIEETTVEAAHGGDAEIRTSAKHELPVLRLHFALSERALRTAG